MGHDRSPSDDGLEHDSMVSAAGRARLPEDGESPTLDCVLQPATPEGSPPRAPYRLLQRIGVGGMGEVWLAEQSQPIRRRVALKLIRGGFGSKEVVARFESERQALAMMDHPGIARVYDAGTTEDGLPYFAMEHVQGDPIHTHCDRVRATVPERIELLIEVCGAVQHAHQKAIIHRDLKPSNILVSLQDGKARPKVIDFGVAKAVGQKLTDQTMYTALGQIVGTLEYMSPEQAEMSAQDVDTRTDVYAQGVVLTRQPRPVPPRPRGPRRRRALYFEAQEMLYRVYGSEHPEIAQTLDNVAFFLVDKGDYARAEEMTRRSLELNRRLLDDDHPRVGDSLVALADIHLRLGDVEEAEQLTLRSLAILRASLPPDHLKIAAAESVLGKVRTAQGRFEEAEPLVVESYERMLQQKEKAPERKRGLDNVIGLYDAWGRPDEAARYRALRPAPVGGVPAGS